MQATMAGCHPLLETNVGGACQAFMTRSLEQFVAEADPDAVILAARWTVAEIPMLRQTIDHLRTLTGHVIVAGPVPEYDDRLPNLLARQHPYHSTDPLTGMRQADRLTVEHA